MVKTYSPSTIFTKWCLYKYSFDKNLTVARSWDGIHHYHPFTTNPTGTLPSEYRKALLPPYVARCVFCTSITGFYTSVECERQHCPTVFIVKQHKCDKQPRQNGKMDRATAVCPDLPWVSLMTDEQSNPALTQWPWGRHTGRTLWLVPSLDYLINDSELP